MALIAIIPARGGSKRLPGKNIKEVEGHPLIAYTISAALESELFAEVVVSSDSDAILEAAQGYGACLLKRPLELATDEASLFPVCEHLLTAEKERGRSYDALALLMPNCPLRSAQDITQAYRAFSERALPFQISVTPYHWHYPFWALQEAEKSRFFFGETYLRRSQELPEVACPTGAVWWAQTAALLREKTFYGPGFGLFSVPWERAVDIDDTHDWEQFLTIRAGLLARGQSVVEAKLR